MCNPLNPTCIPGVIAGNIANGAIDQFVAKIGEGLNKLFELLATSWFNVPSPDVANSTVVQSLSGDLRWITIYIAIFGMLFGLGRMAWELKAAPALMILRMIINLVAVSALGATIVAILVDAGDQFAPWVVSRATGEPFSSSTLTGLLNPATLQSNVAIGLIVGLLAMLGTLAQVIFMVVRGAMLIVLVALLPTIAAGTATEEGMARFKKMLALVLAFVCYKPAAAIIYAAGLRLMHGGGQQPLMSMMYGMTLIILAALALPAVIKFLAPVAAAGSSSIFSGGAAAAAAIATGAAVVTLGGSAAVAGAGAGAGGAAAAGSAGAGAGTASGAASAIPSGRGTAAGSSSAAAGASGGGSGSAGAGEGAEAAASGGSPGGSAGGPASSSSSGGSSSTGAATGEGTGPTGAPPGDSASGPDSSSSGATTANGSPAAGSAAPSGSSGTSSTSRGAGLGNRASEALGSADRAVPEDVDDGPTGAQGGKN